MLFGIAYVLKLNCSVIHPVRASAASIKNYHTEPVLKYPNQNRYFLHLICLPLIFPHIIWGTTEWNLISRYLYLSHMPYCQSHICACWPFLPSPPTFWWVLMKRKGSINWAGHAWSDRWDGISSGLWASSLMPQLCFQPFFEHPNSLVIRIVLCHPTVSNRRSWTLWKRINPPNGTPKYLCYHHGIFRLYFGFRNQSDTFG